jgi:hypothetical protein
MSETARQLAIRNSKDRSAPRLEEDGRVLELGRMDAWLQLRQPPRELQAQLAPGGGLGWTVFGSVAVPGLPSTPVRGLDEFDAFEQRFAECHHVLVLHLASYEEAKGPWSERLSRLEASAVVHWRLALVVANGNLATVFITRLCRLGAPIPVSECVLSTRSDTLLPPAQPQPLADAVPRLSEMNLSVEPSTLREARAWLEAGEAVSWNVLAAGWVAPSAQRTTLVQLILRHLKDGREPAVVISLWKWMRCSGATTLSRAAIFDVTQQTSRLARFAILNSPSRSSSFPLVCFFIIKKNK